MLSKARHQEDYLSQWDGKSEEELTIYVTN
jgi:hypothetical protein